MIELPIPNGKLNHFQIMKSPVMEPELAAKYPEIQTFCGTDGINYIRICITPTSFKAFVLTPSGDVIIESVSPQSVNHYISYFCFIRFLNSLWYRFSMDLVSSYVIHEGCWRKHLKTYNENK